MSRFAKVYDVDNGQVLFLVEEDESETRDNVFKLRQITDFEWVRFDLALGGLSEALALELLGAADLETAKGVRGRARSMAANFSRLENEDADVDG